MFHSCAFHSCAMHESVSSRRRLASPGTLVELEGGVNLFAVDDFFLMKPVRHTGLHEKFIIVSVIIGDYSAVVLRAGESCHKLWRVYSVNLDVYGLVFDYGPESDP